MLALRATFWATAVGCGVHNVMLFALMIAAVVPPALCQERLPSTRRLERHASNLDTPIVGTLDSRADLERRLTRDDGQAWTIRLRAGDFLDVEVDSNEIDVAVRVYDPANAQIGFTAHRQSGPRRVSVVARTSGEHRIRVSSLETTETVGTYHIRLVELRSSTGLDRQRVDASRLFAGAEALRDRMTAALALQAIHKYQAVLNFWTSIGDPVWRSFVLTRLADLHDGLGKSREARTYYRRALECSETTKDNGGQARALNGLSRTDLVLGDTASARTNAQRAIEASRNAGARGLEAEAMNNLGDVEAFVGRTQQSLTIYADALAAADLAGDRRQRARALLNMGYSRWDLREADASESLYAQALLLWKAAGDEKNEAIALNAFGHLYQQLGKRQEALNSYRRARHVFERIGDFHNLGVTFNGMGLVYLELGDRETALAYYKRQLQVQLIAGSARGQAGALARIGYCHYLLGQSQAALGYFDNHSSSSRRSRIQVTKRSPEDSSDLLTKRLAR